MDCLNCGKKTGKRSQYCDDKCKMAYHRNKNRNTETVTEPFQSETVTPDSVTIPIDSTSLPANYGRPDCACRHCTQLQANKIPGKLNHGAYMTATELELNGFKFNRVALPGDVDYEDSTSQGVAAPPGAVVI